jgi:hypothetical protein
MFIRAFTVYFICSMFPLVTAAVQIARGAQPRLMPEGQALAALRAKAPDAEFAIIRTIDPEADATAAVMESLREARAKHPDRFSDNGMSNLLEGRVKSGKAGPDTPFSPHPLSLACFLEGARVEFH